MNHIRERLANGEFSTGGRIQISHPDAQLVVIKGNSIGTSS